MEKRRKIKRKLLLLSVLAFLLVSCGGGGGSGAGAGTSNLPVKPETTVTNPIQKNLRDMPLVEVIQKQNTINNEIPTDITKIDGHTQRIAVIDSNFTKNREQLNKKYPGFKLIETSKGNNSTHGEEVLSIIMEDTKFKPIVANIGKENTDADIVLPNKTLYENMLAKFGNQKIKIFNQSFGTIEEMTGFNSERNTKDYRAALSNIGNLTDAEYLANALDEGQELVNFYEKQVREGALFVWANGNTNKEVVLNNATLNAGLPKFDRDLEKGWITVVGIKERNAEGLKNIHYNPHLAYSGAASYWAISANAESLDKLSHGSSFAAPRVAKAAALIAEKFPWMTNDQIRQTLFTTTDDVEVSKDEKVQRRIDNTPSTKYGWGMLNEERALKGPGAFINILSQYKDEPNSNNIFKANIPDQQTSYFENNIYGDGGLEKLGKGSLHLTGNNIYRRGSTVSEGNLEIYQIHAGKIDIKSQGTLVLHERAIVGYNDYSPFIERTDIKVENITDNRGITNEGNLKIKGNSAIIGGDYNALKGSKTEIDFSSKVKVVGKINIEGSVVALSNNYISTSESKVLMEGKSISGDIENVSTNGMKTASAKVDGGNVIVELSRENVVDYVGNVEGTTKNVAESVEKVFTDLDQKVKSGIATQEELTMGATIQQMSKKAFALTTEKMSGEIYASAQALTFSQAQNINRDLSNRLSGLDNLKLSNGEVQTWISAIGSNGKLRKSGYASADTHVVGGQFGVDKKFNDTTNLGIAMSYSYANADFNRYAGDAKSDMVGLSLYGKKELGNSFYTAGRIGIAHISTKVERELVNSTGTSVQGRVKHDDIMSSLYLEVGKKFAWLTPFVGYSHDYLRRGSFSESNAAWGIHSDSKNYVNTNLLLGLRAEFAFEKYKLQSYVTQAINVGDRDLSYEGHFTGNTTRQKFRGIEQAKNTTWIGLGVFREFNSNFGIYGNIDFRIEDGKRADSVFSTGLQYKF